MSARFLETHFLTISCYLKKNLLQSGRAASLLVDVLLHYREQQKYKLHEFVIMPNHAHILLSPLITIERSVQLIKGGFSFRANNELSSRGSVWQPSYWSRRVRDSEEYNAFRKYTHMNPVRKHLIESPQSWPFSSATGDWQLDSPPARFHVHQDCFGSAEL